MRPGTFSPVRERRIVKVFYLSTNIVRTHERNAGRGVPLLVVAEHAIGTTADRVAFITIAQVVASLAFNYRQTALDPSLAPASDSPIDSALRLRLAKVQLSGCINVLQTQWGNN